VSERQRLIEAVADVDETLGDLYLNDTDPATLSTRLHPSALRAAIRRALVSLRADCAVLCGAAARNRGVQPLLDAVVQYLPSPLDRPPVRAHPVWDGRGLRPTATEAEPVLRFPDPRAPLCALAFKVRHTEQAARMSASATADAVAAGASVYVRVYSGTLRSREVLRNTGGVAVSTATVGGLHATGPSDSVLALSTGADSSSRAEVFDQRVHRIVEVQAEDVRDVDLIEAGNIGALFGLNNTRTGDTLTAPLPQSSSKSTEAAHLVKLSGIPAPEPVFFAAVETNTSNDEVRS
jgi:elongation factor G